MMLNNFYSWGEKNTSYDALALKYVKMHKIETAI